MRRPCEKGRWCPEGSIKSQPCNITVGHAGMTVAPAASGNNPKVPGWVLEVGLQVDDIQVGNMGCMFRHE